MYKREWEKFIVKYFLSKFLPDWVLLTEVLCYYQLDYPDITVKLSLP